MSGGITDGPDLTFTTTAPVTLTGGGVGQASLKDQFPLRVLIGQDDVTFLLDNTFTFSSVDPGGYEICSLTVPRDMPQTLRGAPIRIDTGLHTAWEGRVSEVQRSLGYETTITGEGYGALLKDSDAAMIFVDRDLTAWQGPSVQRQINLLGAGYTGTAAQVAADSTTGNPSLALTVTGPWATGGIPSIEALYDAQGIPLATLYFVSDYLAGSIAAGFGSTVFLMTTDTFTADDSATISSSTTGSLSASMGNRVFAAIQTLNTAAGGSANVLYGCYWQNIAVYGNHGLTIQGGAPNGFYPSQIAAWAMGQAVGLQAGTIPVTDATGYVIPHSVYLTPVSLDQIIGDMALANGWHWGVWESPTPLTGPGLPRFDFRPRPLQGQYTASCLRADCNTCDIREDLSGMYDTAVITYSDVSGVSRQLTVTADNPILDAAGIHRTVELNGGTMTAATAAIFGQEALTLLYTQTRVSGSLSIDVPIGSMAGPMPAWLLKPGIDRLRINDLPSTDAFGVYNDVPITRMEFSGGVDGYKTSLEVGVGASLVETLQSRLNAAAVFAQ